MTRLSSIPPLPTSSAYSCVESRTRALCAGFGSPGPRDYTTQKVDLKSQLVQPLMTALAGILVTDVIMLVPLVMALFIGQLWLPVAFWKGWPMENGR